MASYYCDAANGNDSTGDGSIGTPWATLQKAIDNASGGDVIHIADTLKQTAPSGGWVWNTGYGGGSVTSPTVFRSYNVDGTITLPNGNVGAELDGSAESAIFSTTSMPDGVICYGLELHNTTGTLVDCQNYWAFLDCYLHTAGGAHALDGGTYFLVYGCLFGGTPGTGTNVDGIRTGAANVVLRNEFTNCGGASINANSQGCFFIDNLVHAVDDHGLILGNDFGTVLGNTLVGDAIANKDGVNLAGSGDTMSFVFDNLVTDWDGTSAEGISVHASAVQGVTGRNHFFNNTGDEENEGQFLIDLGSDGSTDPEYANAAGGDFAPGTNVKAQGWPQDYPAGNTTSYRDKGAVQREEPAGGGGAIVNQGLHAIETGITA